MNSSHQILILAAIAGLVDWRT